MHVDECIHLCNMFFSFCPFIPPSTMLFQWLMQLLLQFTFCCLSLSILSCVSDPTSNLLCLCWELLQAWLYMALHLFFKYNYFFTHSPRITFQGIRANPIGTLFLLSLSRQCQPLECSSENDCIPTRFIKFSCKIERAWYGNMIRRFLKAPTDAVC